VKPQAPQQVSVLQSTFSRSLFPLPFSERRLVLMALDLLAVNGALLLALVMCSRSFATNGVGIG